MKVDKETLKKIAHLARVEIQKGDEEGLLKDLQQILAWIDKLDTLDTDDVEPLTHMTFEQNRLREDIPQNSLTREAALKNAPDHDEEFFKVPKVLK